MRRRVVSVGANVGVDVLKKENSLGADEKRRGRHSVQERSEDVSRDAPALLLDGVRPGSGGKHRHSGDAEKTIEKGEDAAANVFRKNEGMHAVHVRESARTVMSPGVLVRMKLSLSLQHANARGDSIRN